MTLSIINYSDLIGLEQQSIKSLEKSLLQKGIVGIRGIPNFEKLSRIFIDTAYTFSRLPEKIKKQYAPDRDAGETEGYELGAEKFLNKDGYWQVDNKKASYYAFVPDHIKNKWPKEIDLRTPYLALGELIFGTGKLLLNVMGLNENRGLHHSLLQGYGRMLHYQADGEINAPDWCGAHYDHGVFTGLVPAYYFLNGKEIAEPSEAGLYIQPNDGDDFQKIDASDKSILLFQVGEFGQLISNDRIRATKHVVKKVTGEIERFTFALFYSADDNCMIHSKSALVNDSRYKENQTKDGFIRYDKWQEASYERYRAK